MVGFPPREPGADPSFSGNPHLADLVNDCNHNQ